MDREHPVVVPTVTGERVRLRPFEADDVAAVIDASTDPLIPMVTSVPADADSAAAAAFIERQHARATDGSGYSFAVEVAGICVGQIGLWIRDLDQGRATVGYWIRPASRRRGYAVAALRTLSALAFATVEVDRLQLFVEPWNEASWHAAERAGYEREGLLRSWQRVGDERRDMLVYALTRDAERVSPAGFVAS